MKEGIEACRAFDTAHLTCFLLLTGKAVMAAFETLGEVAAKAEARVAHLAEIGASLLVHLAMRDLSRRNACQAKVKHEDRTELKIHDDYTFSV